LPFQGGCIVVATNPGLRRVAPYPGLLCYAPSGRLNACLKGTLHILFIAIPYLIYAKCTNSRGAINRAPVFYLHDRRGRRRSHGYRRSHGGSHDWFHRGWTA